MKRRAMLGLLLLGALAPSCGALVVTGEADRAVFVATFGSADVAVGAVVVDRAITVYVCGGPTRFATVSQWFEGHLDDEGATLWAADGAQLNVRRDGDRLYVTLRTSPLEAVYVVAPRVAHDDDVAGLYDARDDGGRAGVIVLPAAGGGDPEVVGAWRVLLDLASQVTPIRPIVRSSRALRVNVHRGATLRALWVLPVTPSR